MATNTDANTRSSSTQDDHTVNNDVNHNTRVNTVINDTGSIAGFPKLAIKRIREAQKLNKLTIYLVMLALVVFLIFGTIASLEMFRDNESIYLLFHYVPYLLVTLAIPLLLYQAFIISRYQLCQPSMLIISIGGGILLLAICLIFSLSNWLWIAIASWIGVAYWFQATFKRFFKFIDTISEG